MNQQDTIYIRGLSISAILGVLPVERVTPQQVLFDIEIYTDITSAATSTQLSDTIDYAHIATRVEQMAVEGRYLLVESLVEDVAQAILCDTEHSGRINAVRVAASKPQALPNSNSVGVEIYRQQS